MNKYITEFIGTFFFVLTIVMTSNNGAGAMAPVAIGAAYMVMIYAGSHLSGAHYNPAVTLGIMMRGKMERVDVAPYMLSQIAGSVIAALIASFLLGCTGGVEVSPLQHNVLCSILSEFLGTFALVFVVLNVTTTRSNSGNWHYGIAIGATAMVMAFALGGISGGAFNPAVAIGFSIIGMTTLGDVWLYLIGDLMAAAAATVVFQALYGRGD